MKQIFLILLLALTFCVGYSQRTSSPIEVIDSMYSDTLQAYEYDTTYLIVDTLQWQDSKNNTLRKQNYIKDELVLVYLQKYVTPKYNAAARALSGYYNHLVDARRADDNLLSSLPDTDINQQLNNLVNTEGEYAFRYGSRNFIQDPVTVAENTTSRGVARDVDNNIIFVIAVSYSNNYFLIRIQDTSEVIEVVSSDGKVFRGRGDEGWLTLIKG